MPYQSGNIAINYNINPNLELTQAWDNDGVVEDLQKLATVYRKVDEDKIKQYRDAQAQLIEGISNNKINVNDLGDIHDELLPDLKKNLDELAQYDKESLEQIDFNNPLGYLGIRNIDKVKKMGELQEKIAAAKFRTKRYNDYRAAILNTVNDTPDNEQKARDYLAGKVDDLELDYPPDINVRDLIDLERKNALQIAQVGFPETISSTTVADPNNPFYETTTTTMKVSKPFYDRVMDERIMSSGKQGVTTVTQKDSNGGVVTTTQDKTSVDFNADKYIRNAQKNVEMPIYGFNESGVYGVIGEKKVGDMSDEEWFGAYYAPTLFGTDGVNTVVTTGYNKDKADARKSSADIATERARASSISQGAANDRNMTNEQIKKIREETKKIRYSGGGKGSDDELTDKEKYYLQIDGAIQEAINKGGTDAKPISFYDKAVSRITGKKDYGILVYTHDEILDNKKVNYNVYYNGKKDKYYAISSDGGVNEFATRDNVIEFIAKDKAVQPNNSVSDLNSFLKSEGLK